MASREDKILYVSYVYSEKVNLFLIRALFTLKTSINFHDLDLDQRIEVTSDGYISGFFDEEELTKFSYDLSEQFKQDKVCLISPEAFNNSLEASNKIGDLIDKFIEHGNILENPDRVKRGFLSNIIR
ncbi:MULTISPECIES: hypothetical protein [Halobacteriovorax]|uniref:Uncharacterized protein n=1 Tax=Halobacteriovorax vibrionivorans TaxID=2152716 RepID=A0ABY0IIW0_9BACT|nr:MULTISPECIES: hypothetical protein [Halobacteriovorax]AYF45479.1 hypothetical protein BALOs_2482 [Halobacteriovorax sp. BALOs_7]RZF22557.1 hypothetical protein DAY19_01945 [Halobacteriovorax vibrionivorans]TGD47749.1 hypothetical protein EP118_07310 [Halobacteriovorax sp. Y22]